MKRWRSIRRKIAKNSNRKGIYSHSIWNNFRKPGIYLMVTVILLITKVGILYTYGGEFGGFDIDIGADEGIFDNWEEAEGNQETTEPEQKENGSSNGNESNNNSNNDSANGGTSSNDIENETIMKVIIRIIKVVSDFEEEENGEEKENSVSHL